MSQIDTPPSRRLPRRINKRTGTTRERTGCLTCRQRKKRCDLAYPVCKQCTRLNFICQREEPRLPTRTKDTQSSEISNASFRLSQCPDPILFWVDDHNTDYTSPSSRRNILRYYAQTFTHLLTTNLENNSFLAVFLPMAMHDTALLNALIAWASSHLSLRDSSFEQVARQNRSAALNDLQNSLGYNNSNIEVNLAITLVLCSMESITADHQDAWYLHLVGASAIISSCRDMGQADDDLGGILDQFEDAHTGRWLLRNFAYHDILMAVAMDRMPLLDSQRFLRLDEGLADSYFGFASGVLALTSDITALNAEVKFYHDMETESHLSTSEILSLGSSLEYRLKEWTCPSSPDRSLMLLAESYRSSALLYLYRVLRRAVPEKTESVTKTANEVARIVENIDKMPTRCLPECTLLFPLFLAGGEAIEEMHIRSIRGKMLDMIESRGFKNVQVALSVLEKVWRLNTQNQNTKIDWIDVIHQEGINLSLS